MKYTKRTPKKKNKKQKTKNKGRTPEKPKRRILHQTPNFLPLTRLEPTPLASKLIEHSRFLTSIFPFFLFITCGWRGTTFDMAISCKLNNSYSREFKWEVRKRIMSGRFMGIGEHD